MFIYSVVFNKVLCIYMFRTSWSGEGTGRVEKGEVSYEEPETKVDGSCHGKEGFQVSKRDKKGSKRESARGDKKQGDCVIYCNRYMCI
jgi:hypothetical protein